MQLQTALSARGVKIFEHETQLSSIRCGMKDLTEKSGASSLCHLPSWLDNFTKSSLTWNPYLCWLLLLRILLLPPWITWLHCTCIWLLQKGFQGTLVTVEFFLVQCGLHFRHNLAGFVSDQAEVVFIVSHLTGRAAAWATTKWPTDSNIFQSLADFQNTMSKIYDNTLPARVPHVSSR